MGAREDFSGLEWGDWLWSRYLKLSVYVRQFLFLVFGLVYSVPQTQKCTNRKMDGNLKTLFKDPQMICFLVSCFLDCLGSYSVFAYTSVMPEYFIYNLTNVVFKENAISLGLDSTTSSWIFSGLGVGGFVGRIAGGHICDVVRSKLDDRKVIFVLIIGKIFASIGKSYIFQKLLE